jgi:hypothetical protein
MGMGALIFMLRGMAERKRAEGKEESAMKDFLTAENAGITKSSDPR